MPLLGSLFALGLAGCAGEEVGRKPHGSEAASGSGPSEGIDTDSGPRAADDTGWADHDGDGATIAGGDCDDDDPAVYPGAAEVCNEQDDDCDGLVDEADPDLPVQGYEDADGDGYAGTASRTCDIPTRSADCDDADPAVHPGATETCETAHDDDCDGITQGEDLPGCTDYALDEDADGYGSDTDSACLCEPEAPYTAVEAGDCDDADPSVHPGGARCRFSGVYSLDDADLLLAAEDASDSAGRSVGFAGDVDGEGADDILIGAPYEGTNGPYSGAVYVVDDATSGSATLSTAVAKIMGECADCCLGEDAAGVADTDGDGYDDILVGEPDVPNEDILTAGAAFLYRGPVTGELYADDADAQARGEAGATGTAVASVGDQDADGLPDLLVGQPFSDGTAEWKNSGRAYVLTGTSTGSIDLDDAIATFDAEASSDTVGRALDGGRDLDGDGSEDLAIGAPAADDPENLAGAVYILRGPVGGSYSLGDADAELNGEDRNDGLGRGISLVADVDGDGNDDLLAGASHEGGTGSSYGAAYLVCAPPDGSSSVADATAKLRGSDIGSWTGYSVSGVGDLDLDGYGDLLVGSWADHVWLVYGPVSGTMSLEDASATWMGTAGSLAGYDVAGDGDVDADGVPDFLVGAPWDRTSGTGGGMVYLVLGSGS